MRLRSLIIISLLLSLSEKIIRCCCSDWSVATINNRPGLRKMTADQSSFPPFSSQMDVLLPNCQMDLHYNFRLRVAGGGPHIEHNKCCPIYIKKKFRLSFHLKIQGNFNINKTSSLEREKLIMNQEELI